MYVCMYACNIIYICISTYIYICISVYIYISNIYVSNLIKNPGKDKPLRTTATLTLNPNPAKPPPPKPPKPPPQKKNTKS